MTKESESDVGRPPAGDGWIQSIERPDPKLWTYYLLCCLATGPLFPIVVLPNWFRYHTMRYKFDSQGISMRWGILFRREVVLNYARIQDIHLVSNFVERWLGLARIQIQTASGSATPEMTIEGLPQFEAIRDFLYARMRGTSGDLPAARVAVAAREVDRNSVAAVDAAGLTAVTAALREVTAELRAVRETLERGRNE